MTPRQPSVEDFDPRVGIFIAKDGAQITLYAVADSWLDIKQALTGESPDLIMVTGTDDEKFCVRPDDVVAIMYEPAERVYRLTMQKLQKQAQARRKKADPSEIPDLSKLRTDS